MGGGRKRTSTSWPELTYDLDEANDIVIQVFKILCWHPPLSVMRPTYALKWVSAHERCPHLKASDRTKATIPHIPITGYLGRVLLIGNRIENGLLGQARRPPLEARLA